MTRKNPRCCVFWPVNAWMPKLTHKTVILPLSSILDLLPKAWRHQKAVKQIIGLFWLLLAGVCFKSINCSFSNNYSINFWKWIEYKIDSMVPLLLNYLRAIIWAIMMVLRWFELGQLHCPRLGHTNVLPTKRKHIRNQLFWPSV